MKKVIITGITGQDGSYLAEYLLKKNCTVFGIIRRSSTFNTARIDHLLQNKNLKLFFGDLQDNHTISDIITKNKIDTIFNLGAQSHVKVSFEMPEYTGNVDALSCLKLFETVKNISRDIKIYQASTSEMFGGLKKTVPQNENTKFTPMSPYGAAKLYAYNISKIYRNSYGLFISNGILFNHESERRGKTFLTRKLSIGISKIMRGEIPYIIFGNIYSLRDWGYAPEYVDSMIKIISHNKADDFVVATGNSYSVKDLIKYAFKISGFKVEWIKNNGKINLIDKKTGKIFVKTSNNYFRPSEVDHLRGDYSKAKKYLKWSPNLNIFQIIEKMIKHDYDNPKCPY